METSALCVEFIDIHQATCLRYLTMHVDYGINRKKKKKCASIEVGML